MTSAYPEIYQAWKNDPQTFWGKASALIDWYKPATKIFDPAQGPYGRWFAGAECNTCYNMLDRHIEAGRGDVPAILYDSPVSGQKARFTYSETLEQVMRLSAVMQDFGIQKGDRVLIYMPMVPQALFAMMACARLGAIHSVVFGGFSADELAARIDDATPALIIASSCGLEANKTVSYKPLLDKAIASAKHQVKHCLIHQREQCRCELITGRDHDFTELCEQAAGRDVPCTPVAATDPLYILYTSGTTGKPKGVVRDNGGYMVALAWSMGALYDIHAGDIFWTASDIGWVVGHSYIVYAPLLIGATTVLFEGKPVGTPDAGTFWRVVADHKVKVLFTAPTALRAIKREDPEGKLLHQYDLSSLEALYLAGERADPNTLEWAEQMLNRPVIDHWWQTETGWPIAGNPRGLGMLPVKHGSTCVPMPGYDVQVLDDAGHPAKTGELGNIVIKLPMPPGCLPTLWQADQRFHEAYLDEFKGYYKSADAGYMDEDGYIFIMSRTDDIINVAGHRLSTGSMEEVIAGHPQVAECAVIGIADKLKGQIPCGFIVLKAGVTQAHSEIEAECVERVRDQIGPVAALRTVLTVNKLPKTRSGKILRSTMQKIADHEPWRMPATIEDPQTLDDIRDCLHQRGIGTCSEATKPAA